MINRSFRLALVACSLASSAMFVSVSANANSNLITKEFALGCSNGNFVGRASGIYTIDPKTRAVSAHIQKYKITRLGLQNGGNKANLNMGMSNSSSTVAMGVYSLDNLRQDDWWREVALSRWLTRVPGYPVSVGIEFVFDKSGADPKCKASKVLTL
ncbi:hypothetical protein [Pseudomonas sp. RL_5y_Pfl2_69]|uniref:hypothetical protein n=1 Tax=Pseudomonas sp. RL_5y_Pfl2_69 TaxID=3088711 RepID=UPI0030D98860